MTQREYDFELLKQLTETGGVPGYEGEVRAVVREALEPEVDELRGDEMGNVVGTVHGDSDYSVLVAAHMDEIGFMIRHVDEEGFLELDPLGGWDPRVLKAQRVTVHTETRTIPGVIGSAPPHTMEESELEGKDEVEDVRVDLGMPAEQVTERVDVGDIVTTRATTERMGHHVVGKALDNRVSVFALVEAARALSDPSVTVHFVATVQEEVGLRGARAVGIDLNPDLGLALDTTVANDVPGFEAGEHVTTLGDGAGIKLKDGSVITNRKVHRRLRTLAEDRDIAHQFEVLPAGGTDTAELQRAAGATPVGAVSFPTRYLHTPVESVHERDLRAAIDLAVAFLETETGDHDYAL